MRAKFITLAIAFAALLLSGCTTPAAQEQAGMVIGGILGGALGAQVGRGHGRTAATIIGSIAGATLGGSVGRSMDDTDRLKLAHSLENVRTGVPSQWRNPDTGNQYSVVPTRTYETGGTPCREFTVNGNVGGKPEQIVGTACRQADGSWRVAN